MSFEPGFLDLMSTSVVRKAFSGRDQYGKPTYSTAASTYQARVVSKPLIVPRPDGVDLDPTDMMYLATTDAISALDQISFLGTTRRILEVARETDEDGVHHMRIRTKGA